MKLSVGKRGLCGKQATVQKGLIKTAIRLIGQKELAKTATIIEKSMVVAVLSCL